ncbi:PREDICTED: sodium-dependent lysophosphatidylcholine symporter 1 [Nanorana parkeri]|uniref:sodium-dependent lysophosphatidylcholine symporter 1 n=1 Tax=Nanorana parkeri TaxID=125878 RepID=UPI000854FA6C|nr:PREDICTED: sodium-dependent lysophosphatidylcholine symporter 1 [Nanorana parkeri]
MEKQSESASCTGLLGEKEKPKIQGERQRGKHKLSVCSKICYAIGGAPYQITGCALGFFLQMYLLDVVQMPAINASIILFTGRVWDAITDPLVGFFVSKSSWTPLGRLLPWIILSTPFGVICYFLIWFVPEFINGQTVWYLTFYCLFQTLVTCYHVPYSALTMFISKEQSDRDSATGYRMTVEVLGTVLGTAIQGQIVGNVDTCKPVFFQMPSNNTSVPPEDSGSLGSTREAYMIAAGVIGAIYILCAVILSLGVREKRDSCELLSEQSVSFWQGLKLVMSHRPYIRLIAGFLFTSLAFMLLEGNFALFLKYTLQLRNDYPNILLVIMISATLTVPFWQWFLTRFGKKTAVYFGISSVIPFLVVACVVKINHIVTYVVAVAAGLSVAAAYLLPWSMLPDVIDDFILNNPESPGHEAIFFSFYVFFTKFASGVSLGISTLSLDFAGYQALSCDQPEAVNLTLKLLVCAAPILLICVGLLLFKLYPIDEEKRKENKKALQLLRETDRDSDSDSMELASNL